MPSKKPSSAPSTASPRTSTQPPPRQPPAAARNVRQQADNRWQRTKRYGWDGR